VGKRPRHPIGWMFCAAALSFVVATVFTPVKNALQEHVDRRIKPAAGLSPSGHHAGVEDLLMLSVLHRRGVLTDEEFAAKKKLILGI